MMYCNYSDTCTCPDCEDLREQEYRAEEAREQRLLDACVGHVELDDGELEDWLQASEDWLEQNAS